MYILYIYRGGIASQQCHCIYLVILRIMCAFANGRSYVICTANEAVISHLSSSIQKRKPRKMPLNGWTCWTNWFLARWCFPSIPFSFRFNQKFKLHLAMQENRLNFIKSNWINKFRQRWPRDENKQQIERQTANLIAMKSHILHVIDLIALR